MLNKQRKDEVLIGVEDVALGHTSKLRWNDTGKWLWSTKVIQPPIVDRDDFDRVQALISGRARRLPTISRTGSGARTRCADVSGTGCAGVGCKATGSTTRLLAAPVLPPARPETNLPTGAKNRGSEDRACSPWVYRECPRGDCTEMPTPANRGVLAGPAALPVALGHLHRIPAEGPRRSGHRNSPTGGHGQQVQRDPGCEGVHQRRGSGRERLHWTGWAPQIPRAPQRVRHRRRRADRRR
jgi:hypothetical protein